MTKIYKSKDNTSSHRKYMIPKFQDENNNHWVEIIIDDVNGIFVAKRILKFFKDDQWDILNDVTFPSSLLNEFLNHIAPLDK
jgi:hypothetical protein